MSHADLREIDLQSNPFLLALQGAQQTAERAAAVASGSSSSKAATAAAALAKTLAALYEQVAARGGLVLLPPPTQCPKMLDERWAARHILLPADDDDSAEGRASRAVSTVTGSPSVTEGELSAPAPSSQWVHPDGSVAHIASGVVYEGEVGSSAGGVGARVLLEELHYDDEFRSFKVLCLDRALWPPPNGRGAATGAPARKGSAADRANSNGLSHSAGAPVPPASSGGRAPPALRPPRDRPEFRSLCEQRDVLTSVLGEGVATHAIFASPRLDFFFTDFSLAWLGVVARDEVRAAEHIRAACTRTLAEAITCIKQGSVSNPPTPSSGSVVAGGGLGPGASGGASAGPATAKSLATWTAGRYAELEIAIQAHVHSCLHSKIFNATLVKLPAHRAAAERLSKALAALADVGGVSLFDVGLSPHLVGLVDPRVAVEHMRSLHTFVTPLERMACLARVEAALMDSISATSATNQNQRRAGMQGAQGAGGHGHGGITGGGSSGPPLLSRNATLPAGGLSAQVSAQLHASPSPSSSSSGATGAAMSPPTGGPGAGSGVGSRSRASSFHRPRSLTQCNLFEQEGDGAPFGGVVTPGPAASPPSSSSSSSFISPSPTGPSSRATSAAINIAATPLAPSSSPSEGAVVGPGSSSPMRSRAQHLPPLSSSPGPPPLPPKQRTGKHSPSPSGAGIRSGGGGGGPGTPSSSPPSQLASIPPPLSLHATESDSTVPAGASAGAGGAHELAPLTSRRRQSSAPAPLSVSADDLLPLLVFVLLEARPPSVHANIAYMRAYSPGPALLTPSVHSELHYRLANFEAAVSYIESGRLLQHVRESQAAREASNAASSATSGPKRRARPRMSSISIQSTRTLHLLLTPQSSSSSRRNLFNGDAVTATATASGLGSGSGTANSSVANSRRASTDGSNPFFFGGSTSGGGGNDAAAAAEPHPGASGPDAEGEEEEEEEEHSMFDADVEGEDEDEEDACIDPRLLLDGGGGGVGSALGCFDRCSCGGDEAGGTGSCCADHAAALAEGAYNGDEMPDLFARATYASGRALRRSSRSAEAVFQPRRRAASRSDGAATTGAGGGVGGGDAAAAAAASLFGCSIPEPDSLGTGAALPAWLTGASSDGRGGSAGSATAAASMQTPVRTKSPPAATPLVVVAAGDSRPPVGRSRSDTVVRAPMAPFLPRSQSNLAHNSSTSAGAATVTTAAAATAPSVSPSNAAAPPSFSSPVPSPASGSNPGPGPGPSTLSSPLVPLRELEALDEDDLDPLGALTRTKKTHKTN